MPRGNNKNLFLLSVLKGLTYILGFPSILLGEISHVFFIWLEFNL